MSRLFLLVVLLLFCCVESHSQTVIVTPPELDFLGPMGYWIQAKRFGGQVWKPNIDERWHPFRHGEWIPTNIGWLWTSYEPFGWALYHYGWWYYDAGIGWYWIPDYEFAPARVKWRTSPNYVGWAPIPPKGYKLVEPNEPAYETVWNVVPIKDFLQQNVNSFVLREIPEEFAKQSKSGEPQRAAIEKATGKPIEQIQVEKLKRGEQLLYVELPPEIRSRILGEIEKRKNDYPAKTKKKP